MTRSTTQAVKQRIAELVEGCSDGALAVGDLLEGDATLSERGLTSLARMRLLDAVEAEFGVEITLDESGWALTDDLDALAAHLTAR
ncbi:acyl carrier protein [Streptacidiphilus jiangxiensis]|uniref:Phosphopantetheine attachment site n=1 Tax=Streptacidiphilus jiangxiensis TaxID=235985 RepID=A0A1H7FZC3_STRJI|nr:acyl carrier protein [Streptacidiphilus jiangxiensis]SEK31258.1 Phosphopantetheine attachment site [Streptacidiphilus jiangxiensis]